MMSSTCGSRIAPESRLIAGLPPAVRPRVGAPWRSRGEYCPDEGEDEGADAVADVASPPRSTPCPRQSAGVTVMTGDPARTSAHPERDRTCLRRPQRRRALLQPARAVPRTRHPAPPNAPPSPQRTGRRRDRVVAAHRRTGLVRCGSDGGAHSSTTCSSTSRTSASGARKPSSPAASASTASAVTAGSGR